MRRIGALVGFLLAMALAAGGTVASAEDTGSVPEAGPHFLTGPSDLDPLDIALRYLRRHAGEGGLTGADVDALVATDRYRSRHNGVTHLYVMQRIHGIDVPDARANANVTRDGRLINVSTALVADLAAAVNRTEPVLTHAQALDAAARALHLGPAGPVDLLQQASGPARAAALSAPALSRRPIAVKLVYQPVREMVRLAWQVDLETLDAQHRWTVRIDAQDGSELSRFDAVITEPHAGDHVPGPAAPPQDALGQRAEQQAASSDGAAYRVFGHPVESPGHGDRSLVGDPADGEASPFGWHDIDGAAGPEFTTTRGNNVHAYIDSNADNLPDANSEPDGGSGLLFDFPLDLDHAPEQNQPAAVTNLFYWNNVIHDVTHRYGFDEPAGNFQVNNFLRGGAGLDPINAETQDGGDTNNARFFLAPEGMSPRMEMYLWSPIPPNIVTVQAPSTAAGDYPAGRAEYGAQLDVTGPISGTVTQGHDGAGSSDTDGCTSLNGFPPGHIALLSSPSCTRATQAMNAQAAGAIAVILDASTATLQGSHPEVVIPVLGVGFKHYVVLKDAAPFQATLRTNPEQTGLEFDSALDAGVVVHEYGHGISTRLTGGPAVVDCLANDEQMGEGWSDWFGLVLTDVGATERGIGTYVKGQPASDKGIRPAPYSTDMEVNPVTYGDVPTLAVPHGVGYAWASMLWDVYWNLVNVYGFTPDIQQGWQDADGEVTGGNTLAMQLVMDGLKLQPCLPGFVDGRDAILLADQALTGGENQCAIWDGFARRGLGVGAEQGLSASANDGVESFAMPPECGPKIALSPTAFDVSLETGTVAFRELVITNTGAGSEPLTWTIDEAAGDCGTSGDVPWLSVTPTSGSLGAGGSAAAQLRLDAGAVPVGKHTANLCVRSNAFGNEVVAVPVALTVTYPFTGFFGSVENAPALNTVKATATVPIIFSLGGDRGTGIFDVARPASRPVDCQTLDPVGVDEPARTPGSSAVSYDDRSDRYTYPWSTSALWSGTCREFTLGLRDGSTHLAYFSFR